MLDVKRVAIAAALSGAVACASKTPSPALPAATATPSAPSALSDSVPQRDPLFELDTAEKTALRSSEGRAARVGGELRIQLLNGRVDVFKDDTVPPHFGLARYDGYLKVIHSHIVHHVNIEGSGANIIVDDSTGASVIVFGKIAASPDGRRFVVMSAVDPGAGYDPGLIQVWRFVGRKPEKEFSMSTEAMPWQPSDPKWRDSVTIDFLKNKFVDFSSPEIQTPARLVKSGGTWVVADSASH